MLWSLFRSILAGFLISRPIRLSYSPTFFVSFLIPRSARLSYFPAMSVQILPQRLSQFEGLSSPYRGSVSPMPIIRLENECPVYAVEPDDWRSATYRWRLTDLLCRSPIWERAYCGICGICGGWPLPGIQWYLRRYWFRFVFFVREILWIACRYRRLPRGILNFWCVAMWSKPSVHTEDLNFSQCCNGDWILPWLFR